MVYLVGGIVEVQMSKKSKNSPREWMLDIFFVLALVVTLNGLFLVFLPAYRWAWLLISIVLWAVPITIWWQARPAKRRKLR